MAVKPGSSGAAGDFDEIVKEIGCSSAAPFLNVDDCFEESGGSTAVTFFESADVAEI